VKAVKIEIVNNQRNELLKRNEVKFSILHEEGGTPSRVDVRQKLAASLDANEERIYISKYGTKTGSMTTVGEANVYDSAEQAKMTEPKYIILRNSPKTEKKEQQ
jgi:small subunit ribosomal protein S24e